jgi:hypothetical protein
MTNFRLAALSDNRNAFGLRGAVMIARTGEAWEVGVHDLDCPVKGQSYSMADYPDGRRQWFVYGWELARRLPDAPSAVMDSVWQPILEAKK